MGYGLGLSSFGGWSYPYGFGLGYGLNSWNRFSYPYAGFNRFGLGGYGYYGRWASPYLRASWNRYGLGFGSYGSYGRWASPYLGAYGSYGLGLYGARRFGLGYRSAYWPSLYSGF